MSEINKGNPEIWVIDDDQSIRWILDRALTNAGFKVTAFETGSTALMQYKRAEIQARPALIVSDFRMPGINGFELLKQVKNIDKNLPVIIMTAYSELDITIQSYQEGAFEYLAKPFDIDEAIELVKQAYEKSVHAIEHLPDSDIAESITVDNWKTALKQWAHTALENGENAILTKATHDFEKTLIECALTATRGRKQEAAKRLGWGRNTLTRKLKELYNNQ
jgi:two-component system nitrogen regulation response regulator GlnG